MNEMNRKKLYIWRLANFLRSNGMTMSGEELAAHLNRNNFMTAYGEEYAGLRGTYTLITQTYRWVDIDLGLNDDAENIAKAYVKPDGTYAYEKTKREAV
jgi:hypothetical protein